MTHDPSVREVMEATRYLLMRRKRSCDQLIRWTGRDREAVHVLATYVALTTNQALSSLRGDAL